MPMDTTDLEPKVSICLFYLNMVHTQWVIRPTHGIFFLGIDTSRAKLTCGPCEPCLSAIVQGVQEEAAARRRMSLARQMKENRYKQLGQVKNKVCPLL